MKLGFTGTSYGMSACQAEALTTFLRETVVEEFRHGKCIGADEEAASLVVLLCPEAKIIELPGIPGTYLKRNREIVDNSDLLIAAPLQNIKPNSKHAGGTWYTIDYARKQGKPIQLLTR